MGHHYAKGDRVQLSDDGLKAFKQLARSKRERTGTVVRFTSHDLPVIQWDGRKTSDGAGMHPRFLKPATFAVVDSPRGHFDNGSAS